MMLTDDEIKALAYKAAEGETGRREFSADVSWLLAFARAVVAAERERWKTAAIEACYRAGDGPDNGCCPTYWEEAREACIAAIQRA